MLGQGRTHQQLKFDFLKESLTEHSFSFTLCNPVFEKRERKNSNGKGEIKLLEEF